ncbi:MAG: flagellin, partial [Alphaproteobacteria bacterium]|nr:flagellin [Alphaproteobacteria bacterium]
SVVVAVKDISSAAVGMSLADWAKKEGILQSVLELSKAVATLRSFSAELGNNYNIISNRQEFTENLINILTEGADKLTLADMNEESANMLALQTRQQLAINSLSLASQASQAVLKLF